MSKIYFLLGIHNHQPVGNFPHIFEKAFNECYSPFIAALAKYPRVKCSVHISGPLYDWIGANRKDFMSQLKDMTAKGQVEIVSGGYYEPILPLISDEDKLAQISRMNEFIEKEFNQIPKGLWTTERVWEPYLAKIISQSGLHYTFLDDTHFRYAGLNRDEFFGYYLTEDSSRPLAVFPISKQLRYKIPFSQVHETMDLLRSMRDPECDRLITLFDDGEKFGLWPDTYDWVYNQKWLEQFFQQLSDNFEWVETVTAAEALEKFYPEGLVYLPTASYQEMTEWVLEPENFADYKELDNYLKQSPRYARYRDFVRGGFFRNFYKKYPRLNYMHKRMLTLSEKIHKQANPAKDRALYDSLWKAQCNCGYWHGIFGGFYLGHIRAAIYNNLIEAEKQFDKKYGKKELSMETCDLNFDGADEVVFRNKHWVCVSGQRGGSILELSLRDVPTNLVNTITRRRESYHASLSENANGATGDSASSIHDMVKSKEAGLEEHLIYDSYEKVAFCDHLLEKAFSLDDFIRQQKIYSLGNEFYEYETKESKGKVSVRYGYREEELGFSKTFEFTPDTPVGVRYEFGQKKLLKKYNFGVELNLFLQSPDHILIDKKPFELGEPQALKNRGSLQISDGYKKMRIDIDTDTCDIYVVPVYSVSSSEGGFEKVYQQISLLLIYRNVKDHLNVLMNVRKGG